VRSAIRSIAIAVFSSPVALAAPGLTVGHILHDGAICSDRVAAPWDGEGDLFAAGQNERITAAYRRRARAVAFRNKGAIPAGRMRSADDGGR